MAKIANTALTNTFNFWRLRTNELADRVSQFAINNSRLYANTVIANNVLKSLGNTVLGVAGKRTVVNGLLSANGRVTVTTNLNVSGNTSANKSTVTSALTVAGNTTLGGAGKTQTSTGVWTHTGNQTVSGNTSANKASVTVRLIVAGNTVLGAAGKRTILNALISANGFLTVTDRLDVSGNTNLGAAGKRTTITGLANVAGRLSVTTNLSVGANATLSGIIANASLGSANYVLKTNGTTIFWAPVSSSANLAGYLQVANAVATYATKVNPVTSGVHAHSGRSTISTNLAVSGNTSTNKITVTTLLTASGNSKFGAAGKKAVFEGIVSANGLLRIEKTLINIGNTVLGAAGKKTILNGTSVANGYLTVTNRFDVSGNTNLGGAGKKTVINGLTAANGRMTVGTNLTVSGNGQILALGIGTTPGTNGSIRATENITAFYSDERLKDIICNIPDALDKVNSLRGFYFYPNVKAMELGYQFKKHVGVSAQEVQSILQEAVTEAPISSEYLAVQYEKLIPLLIEAIKELTLRVKALENDT